MTFAVIANKLKSSQLNYFLKRVILTLFEELHRITGFAVYFSDLSGLLFRAVITNKG